MSAQSQVKYGVIHYDSLLVEMPAYVKAKAELADLRAKYENELFAAESDTLNNERQTGLAIQAQSAMKDAISALKAGMELDLVTLDLQRSWEALREITGKAGRENLLDEIFSRFCLGK